MIVNDTGLVFETADGKYLTSQGDPEPSVKPDHDSLVIEGQLATRRMPLPNPYNVLVLRLLSISVMRIPAVGALVKRLIARLLVSTRGKSAGKFRREITLGRDLSVRDSWEPRDLKRVPVAEPFSVIHMASSGYWQRGDTGGPDA